MDEEKVFKALADEHRRTLLDKLFERDGQTLSELEAYLPMTRFGVMKHLQLLEDAGLVTTRKVGREKHHYLNPVPIQLVYDRWVSKYAQPWTQSLSGLKFLLENPMTEKPAHIFQIIIRTTPEQLWRALTDGAMTERYYFNSRAESTWQPGAPYQYATADGFLMLDGEVLESDPPRRLVTTFNARWQPDAPPTDASTVTFEITPMGAACKLVVTHANLDPAHVLSAGIVEGWTMILSSLKTLVETGEPLVVNAAN